MLSLPSHFVLTVDPAAIIHLKEELQEFIITGK